MKKILVLFCVLYCLPNLEAQVNIGRSVSPTNLYIRNIKDEHWNLLENSTMYFVVPESLDFEATKKIISEIWTYNTLNFIHGEDYEPQAYMAKGNSVIAIHDTGYGMTKSEPGRPDRVVSTWFAYKFGLILYLDVSVNKKGEKKPDDLELADVIFTPSMRLRYEMLPHYEKDKAENVKDEPDIYNFQLGFIKNYFQILNKNLTERTMLDLEKKHIDESKLKLLKDQTLYAPDWILKRVAIFSGLMKGIDEPEELFEDYKYNYKLLSADEINEMILNGEDFYYLMHTQFNEHQILSIIHSVSGDVIYSAEKKSYNISDNDLEDISKAISD